MRPFSLVRHQSTWGLAWPALTVLSALLVLSYACAGGEPGSGGTGPGSEAEPASYRWEDADGVESGPAPEATLGWQEPENDEEAGAAFAAPNERPFAVASSPDGPVLAGDRVDLIGDDSFDPEGEAVTFLWTVVSGPIGDDLRLHGADTATPTLFTYLPGTYKIELVVSDGEDVSEPALVAVVVGSWFTNATGAAGVPGGGLVRKDGIDYPGGYGTGLAWGDYNNDALPDLYLTRTGGDILYANNGDGTFSDVALQSGLPGYSPSVSVAWADYDNDGWLDVYVVNADRANVLYRSNGDGTFADAGTESGLDVPGGNKGGNMGGNMGGNKALWVDLFNGRSDLLVLGSGPDPAQLLMNEPDTGFRDVTGVSGLSGIAGAGSIALLLDFDADGYQDVLTSFADGGLQLLRYDFPGRKFQDVTPGSGLEALTGINSAIVGDYDNDGSHDLFLNGDATGTLWRNDGEGSFSDVTLTAGLEALGAGTGAGFFDFDNDGALDLLLVNAQDGPTGGRNRLLRNSGDGTFTDVTAASGLGDVGNAKAVGFADYDYDGDLDLYVVNGNGPNRLYRNEVGNRNNWLRVRLQGISSNLLGIGARVEVATSDGHISVAFPAGGPEFGGQSETQLVFGLGNADRANIKVTWPSGLVQDFWGAIPNELIRLREVAMEGW
jgi:hypothetical protein